MTKKGFRRYCERAKELLGAGPGGVYIHKDVGGAPSGSLGLQHKFYSRNYLIWRGSKVWYVDSQSKGWPVDPEQTGIKAIYAWEEFTGLKISESFDMEILFL